MREKHTDSVQNRFTAYLVAAVGNTRRKYWERKYRLQGREFAQENMLNRKYIDFEEQYRAYVGKHTDFIFRDWQRFGELLTLLESLPLQSWGSSSRWNQSRRRWHTTMCSES